MKPRLIWVLDIIVMFSYGAMLRYFQVDWKIIAVLVIATLFTYSYFAGETLHEGVRLWSGLFASTSIVSFLAGKEKMAMWSGVIACALLVILAIFWPSKARVATQKTAPAAKATPQAKAVAAKGNSESGHALITRPSPFWAWMRKNAWGITSGIFTCAALGTVAHLVIQIMNGNVHDWEDFLPDVGVMFLCVGLAYACYLTQVGGWTSAANGVGNFASGTVAPAAGKAVKFAGGGILSGLGYVGNRFIDLVSGKYGWGWTALIISISCFAARWLMFWVGINDDIEIPKTESILGFFGIGNGSFVVNVLFAIGLIAGIAALILPWFAGSKKIAKKWNKKST
ncbi:MAG: hypothetical protein WC444_03165 [Candidatus Paceibacterota bacterium]